MSDNRLTLVLCTEMLIFYDMWQIHYPEEYPWFLAFTIILAVISACRKQQAGGE